MKITAQTETITLDDIARDPLRVHSLSADATRLLIAMLEMARGALKARRIVLSGETAALASVPDAPDRLLRVGEAAQRIGIAQDTLYKTRMTTRSHSGPGRAVFDSVSRASRSI